jgi:hypothetical protein
LSPLPDFAALARAMLFWLSWTVSVLIAADRATATLLSDFCPDFFLPARLSAVSALDNDNSGFLIIC